MDCWSPYYAAKYSAHFSRLHGRWIVSDPDHGGCIYVSGRSKEDAENNARIKFIAD